MGDFETNTDGIGERLIYNKRLKKRKVKKRRINNDITSEHDFQNSNLLISEKQDDIQVNDIESLPKLNNLPLPNGYNNDNEDSFNAFKYNKKKSNLNNNLNQNYDLINISSQSQSNSVSSLASSRIYEPIKWSSCQNVFSPITSQTDIEKIREKELLMFFPDKKMTLMVVTWNMSNISNYPNNLKDLIFSPNFDELADFYLLAFQETTSDKTEMETRIQLTLGQQYLIYESTQYGDLYAVLVGNKQFIWKICQMGTAHLSLRVTTKTKGVVAISFRVFGSSFLFFNSHFSSGNYVVPMSDEGRNQLRIEDYNNIIRSQDLVDSLVDKNQEKQSNLFDNFDYVIWTGDLNFRINLPRTTVMGLISAKQDNGEGVCFENLLEYDELFNGQIEGSLFQEFEEARIQFLPTYKYKFDSGEYVNNRTPAYTDRILYKSLASDRGIECVNYRSLDDFRISDHRPVQGVFVVVLQAQKNDNSPSSGVFKSEIYQKCYKISEKMSEKRGIDKDGDKYTSTVSKTCILQ